MCLCVLLISTDKAKILKIGINSEVSPVWLVSVVIIYIWVDLNIGFK